jgi:murein tripeptide amidase MpaA
MLRSGRRPTLLATLVALRVSIAPSAAAPVAASDFPASDSGYHNFPEMVADIRATAAVHPDIVRVFTIGRSYKGRGIWAAKISDNVGTDEDEPEVLIDALHHAREHLTVEQALYVLHTLADGYGSDDEVTRLVDSREVWIIFAVNPDGFIYDLTGDP